MSSDCSTPNSVASSSSSSTVIGVESAHGSSFSADKRHNDIDSSLSCSPPSIPHRDDYTTSSYEAKGKRRASDVRVTDAPSDATDTVSSVVDRMSLHSSSPSHQSRSPSRRDRTTSSDPPRSAHLSDRARRTRKGRDGASRSLAPSPLRSALTTSPTTGSASQFVSLLGQPVAVSASLSAPNKTSAAATSAALPSLYKASRGRSANVSPSRRWDRRGVSATVLSGASASGSGGDDDLSDQDLYQHMTPRKASWARDSAPSAHLSRTRRLSVPKEEALFPSDEDDSPEMSSHDGAQGHAAKILKHQRRSRRWSSVERECMRGMRILLHDRASMPQHEIDDEDSAAKTSRRGRPRSVSRNTQQNQDDASDLESSSTPSSCTSSCDLNYVPRATDTAAISIKERRNRSTGRSHGARDASIGATSSQGQIPSSTDGSDDPSPAASTPSTSLVQRSPPGFTALKPIVAIPVSSDSDPLLGLATPSVEDMIQIDQVEFFPEEAITAQLNSAETRRKTSPKRSKKSSWIIGDFESEPESDEEQASQPSLQSHAKRAGAPASLSTSPPTPTASSYQARLVSLQGQLRIWSRTQDTSPAPRVRQISSSSEDQTEPEADPKDAESHSSSLLSASWRNLARLPNLILLPGLAARQARESLASAGAKTNGDGGDVNRTSIGSSVNDFAQIYRLASSGHAASDEKSVQAQRNVALKTGRPPSPSPSPSPPASLLGSRQSSNDSVSTAGHAQQAQNNTSATRRGRGVASPHELDRDPSAYVSGLGQPIDPDTELSSVVQLQTFRSRSRSRPAAVHHRTSGGEDSQRNADRQSVRRDGPEDGRIPLSPKKLRQPIELEPMEEEQKVATALRSRGRDARPLQTAETLTVQIPKPNAGLGLRTDRGRHDPFAHNPKPTDIASAPTSPTYRKNTSSSASSADESDSMPSPPEKSQGRDEASVDADGFRIVRRRHRRRSSGPRSLRPKVEAPVPNGFSAFSIEEGEENAENSDSDGEVASSPTRARGARGRRGRDSSPRRSTRQCAVGLFGGGVSAAPSSGSSTPSSRSRRSSRREGSHVSISTPIRSVRSSPDLTYAAAREDAAEAETEDPLSDDPSPPRGSRGRRGAVKVVASSVGQRPTAPQPLLLGGAEGLRRGPSYPPRAGEILEETDNCSDEDPQWPRGRSASQACQNVRLRLLSNSSHLLMLSLELDMIKKQKISAPLKPRWGKHRANDFNPLPSTISFSPASKSKYLRNPFSGSREDECEQDCNPCEARKSAPTASPVSGRVLAGMSTIGGGVRDPSSKLRFSWSLEDIVLALDGAASAST